MREYHYKDIQEITEAGILFRDGFVLSFEECRNGWCVEHKMNKRYLPHAIKYIIINKIHKSGNYR